MNILPRDKQIEIIAALTEGMSIRAVERLTGVHRDTIMRLGARVGRGCAELHDRMMVGVRAGRLELDETWSFVGKKQKRAERHELGASDRSAGNLDGRLSPLQDGNPRRLFWPRLAWRDRKDLQRHQPCRKGRSPALFTC